MESKERTFIVSDGDKEYTKTILFTTEYKGKGVVFFTDDETSEEVQCAYYDELDGEHGNLDPLEQDDYLWANKTLQEWIDDQEDDNEEE